MEINVEETKVMRIWRQPTVCSTDCDRSKTAAECGIFQLFWQTMQDTHVKLSPGLTWQKQLSTSRLFSPANWTAI